MREAAAKLEFERAAELRDQLTRLRGLKPGELLDSRELLRVGSGGKEKVARRGSGSGRVGDRAPGPGRRPPPRPPKRNFGS
jgi:UvrB/uvrC motif